VIDFKAYKAKLLSLGVELNEPVPCDYWQQNETNCPIFLRDLYNLFNGTKEMDADPRNELNIASLEYSHELLEGFRKKGWFIGVPGQYFIMGDVMIDSYYIGIPKSIEESVILIDGPVGPKIIHSNFKDFFKSIHNGNC